MIFGHELKFLFENNRWIILSIALLIILGVVGMFMLANSRREQSEARPYPLIPSIKPLPSI